MREQWAVRRGIWMQCEDASHICTEWLYSRREPWSVVVDFGAGIEWEFARDLLTEHGEGVVGLGQVQVWRLGRHVVLRFSNRDETMSLKAGATDVDEFLERSLAAVPAGEESAHVDVDTAVARILEEADRC